MPNLATCANSGKPVSVSEHHIQFISNSAGFFHPWHLVGRTQGEGGACFELLHNSDDVDLIWPQQIKMCRLVFQLVNLWLANKKLVSVGIPKCCPKNWEILGEHAHLSHLMCKLFNRIFGLLVLLFRRVPWLGHIPIYWSEKKWRLSLALEFIWPQGAGKIEPNPKVFMLNESPMYFVGS